MMIELILALYVCWQPPTENVDGSPISGIASYNVHYGETSGVYDYVTAVEGHLECANIRVSRGTWYIVMTTVDLEGDESSYSNEVAIEEIRLLGPRGGGLIGPSGGRIITD